ARRGGAPDERESPPRDHVGQVVARVLAVLADVPVLVQVVVELGIRLTGHVPLAPERRDVRPRLAELVGWVIAVQVLPENARLVPRCLERSCERLALLAPVVENGEA